MTNADARHLDNLEAQFLADDADVAATAKRIKEFFLIDEFSVVNAPRG